MTPDRHGSAKVEHPNALEIVLTREFDAPIGLDGIQANFDNVEDHLRPLLGQPETSA